MSNRIKLLRDSATRPRRVVALLLDGEIRGKIEAVEDALARLDQAEEKDGRLNSAAKRERAALEADLADLRARAADKTIHLVVEGMQRTAYRALVSQHPPRVENGKVIPSDLQGVNIDTVQVPLIRACIVGDLENPDLESEVSPIDTDLVDWLVGSADRDGFLTDRQIEILYMASLVVCRGDEQVPLPRTRSATRSSADA